MNTNILSKDEEKSEGPFCDFGGFAFLEEGESKIALKAQYLRRPGGGGRH